MADRRLYLRFTKTRTQGIIDLYEQNAPVTCATLWKALRKPIRVTVFHAMFAGPEIMTGLPKSAQSFDPTRIPAENQTLTPATSATTVTGTTVYYAPGYTRECATVATIVGPAAKGAPMPTPVPAGAERANCLVVLGA